MQDKENLLNSVKSFFFLVFKGLEWSSLGQEDKICPNFTEVLVAWEAPKETLKIGLQTTYPRSPHLSFEFPSCMVAIKHNATDSGKLSNFDNVYFT